MKGFTLIEIVLVVGILGILTSISINSFQSAQLKKEQGGIVQGIVAHLEKQKTDTQAGKGGSNYGVKFDGDEYILFTGTSYNASSPTNLHVPVITNFLIEETISNASNIIFFSKLYGEANETATITVSHISDTVDPQLIVIEESGTISVIE